MQTYNRDEVNIALDAAKNQNITYYSIYHLALHTAMRPNELLALQWKDIDFILSRIIIRRAITWLPKNKITGKAEYVFRQPKTDKSRRSIPLTPSAFLQMQSYYEYCKQIYKKLKKKLVKDEISDDDLVFCHIDTGQPLRIGTLSHSWSKLCDEAKLKHIRWYDCRHTVATLLIQEGVPLKVVSELLGHSSIILTADTYSHVTPSMMESAAKKLDQALGSNYNEKDDVKK